MPDPKPILAALLLVAVLALPALAQAQGPSASGAATPVFAAYPGVWSTGFGEYDSMKIAFSNYGLPGAPPTYNLKAEAGRKATEPGKPAKKPATQPSARPSPSKGPATKPGGMGAAPAKGTPRPRAAL